MRRTDDLFSHMLQDELHTPLAPRDGHGPHVCPGCQRPFVAPVDALEVDEWHFAVSMRCANCGWEGTELFDDEALERFDVGLDAATRDLLAALETLALENARDDFDRFAAALHAGALLPEDF